MNGSSRTRLLRTPTTALLSVAILALAARLLGIASRPIWYDEAFAVLFSEKGPAAMWIGTLAPVGPVASDVHPLGYYVILWQWMRVFGESLVSIRVLSVLAGVGAVIVMYLLARSLFGPRAAFAAGCVAALAPFQVHYAQEVRMYVFLGFWLLLATYCYWRGHISKHWAWWLGFTLCAALATYTQYLAAFFLLPLAAWPLLTLNWRILRNVAVSGLAALVLCLPWLIHLPAQLAKVDQAYWVERPEPYRLLTLLLVYVTNLPLPGWQLAAGLFAALGVVSIALYETLGAVRSQSPGHRDVLWLVYLSFVPPILMFVFSQWMPVFLERALLPSGAVFCVWLAWSLVEAHQPRQIALLSAILLGAGFTMGLHQHVVYADFPYAPFDALARHLESNRQIGDVIVHSSKLSMLPSRYFDRTLPETYLADPPGSGVDTLAPATQRAIGVQAEPDIRSATVNARRVWYVMFDESNREYVQAGYPRHPDLTWLMEVYGLPQVSHWGDLDVFLFSRGS